MALDIGRAAGDLHGAIRFLRRRRPATRGDGRLLHGARTQPVRPPARTAPTSAPAVMFHYGGHPKAPYDYERLAAP